MKKHSKVLASALTAMLVASAIAGCTKTTTEEKKTPSASVPSGKTVLVWTHLESDFPELKKQAEAWATKTNNKVTVVKDNNDMDKLVVAAKSPTAPDIMWGLPHDHLGQFAAANILEEVGNTMTVSEYASDAVVNAGKYDGKQYGIPIFAETYALFYNKDKVKEAPKTWEDMLKAGKVQWDLTNFYFTYGVLATEGNYVFKNNGGTFDAKDIGLNKEVKGYQVLEALVKSGAVDKNVTGDVPKNNFKTGKTEFYISGPWDVKDMTDAKLNFGVAPMPSIDGKPGKSFMGVQLGYIIKKTRDADQKAVVEDLVKYLSTTDSLAAVGKVGSRLPVKKGITVEGVSQGFADQIANAEPMPNIPQMAAVWDPAKAGMTLLLNGTKDAQGAADYVQQEVTKGCLFGRC